MLGRIVVVLSFLISPPIAVALTTATTVHLQNVAEAEAADRSRTHAVLLEDADPSALGYSGQGDSLDRTVPARAIWTTPDGTSRKGTVVVAPGTSAGASVLVWIDRDGDVTSAPRDPADVSGAAAAFAVFPLIGVPLAAWTLYAVLCFALDAHRQRRWETVWAEVEPDWHSRLL
jgi:hypothetical protein